MFQTKFHFRFGKTEGLLKFSVKKKKNEMVEE